MKRILLAVSLCLIASGAMFAQKKTIKEAKSALDKGNFTEARELIKSALTNPETATDAEAWKIAGDVEFKMADKEADNERLKQFNNSGGWNEPVMYEGMYNMIKPYLTADSLAQLPDTKGKVKNKVRKDIVKNISSLHQYYPNGGIYFNQQNDYAKASEMFELYWIIPQMSIFEPSDVAALAVPDTTNQIIKYYATITAVQSENKERAERLLKKIISEPYVGNTVYKESDPYELLASLYLQNGDSVKYIETLELGTQKFPNNQFLTNSLINVYITAGNKEKALDFLDKAIAADASADICMLSSVKGSLYLDEKDYTKAEEIFTNVLESDPSCERALEGLGLVYAFKAQDLNAEAANMARKDQVEADKKTVDLYTNAMNQFEKLLQIQRDKNDEKSNIKKTLLKLKSVYYNLSLLQVDKQKEYDQVEAELEDLKYD